jgi:hypothetical protein
MSLSFHIITCFSYTLKRHLCSAVSKLWRHTRLFGQNKNAVKIDERQNTWPDDITQMSAFTGKTSLINSAWTVWPILQTFFYCQTVGKKTAPVQNYLGVSLTSLISWTKGKPAYTPTYCWSCHGRNVSTKWGTFLNISG